MNENKEAGGIFKKPVEELLRCPYEFLGVIRNFSNFSN